MDRNRIPEHGPDRIISSRNQDAHALVLVESASAVQSRLPRLDYRRLTPQRLENRFLSLKPPPTGKRLRTSGKLTGTEAHAFRCTSTDAGRLPVPDRRDFGCGGNLARRAPHPVLDSMGYECSPGTWARRLPETPPAATQASERIPAATLSVSAWPGSRGTFGFLPTLRTKGRGTCVRLSAPGATSGGAGIVNDA